LTSRPNRVNTSSKTYNFVLQKTLKTKAVRGSVQLTMQHHSTPHTTHTRLDSTHQMSRFSTSHIIDLTLPNPHEDSNAHEHL
jgi:hypothetical protein